MRSGSNAKFDRTLRSRHNTALNIPDLLAVFSRIHPDHCRIIHYTPTRASSASSEHGY
ncbi:hypothetical protein M422DRAFT_258093 [Sphaerobolus stellatus SS14]|uniref:Uncharacterized protein n=1 Tax=Sphaerobolus stellatus (strain SS14) TaxID=990650 RepID=A0A0C9VCC7_SPHS4|nr:hypothetical protein M422DRAFT_258093 [Sphaerobolus stellatus SS14]